MELGTFIVLFLAGAAVCVIVAFLLNTSLEEEEYNLRTEEKIWPRHKR